MSKIALLAAAALVVIALSGCAASGDVAAPAKNATVSETSAPVLTAAPAPADSVEREFLTAVQRIPGLEDVSLADALAVGNDVCAQLAAGKDPLTMTPVANGAQPDNEDMVMVSALTLCTDQSDAAQQAFIDGRGLAVPEQVSPFTD